MTIGKIGGQSTGLNISAINRSIANKNEAVSGKKEEQSRIMAVISPEGKKQSMIQQLMKQKQELTDRMNSLSASANESGVSVREQMEDFRKQMESLDEQILKLQVQGEEEKEDDKRSGIYEKPMTKEEAETKKMNDVMSLASSSNQMEVISSVKGQVDGRTNVLKSEIKTGYGNMESKIEEVAKLESQSAGLASQLGQKMTDMNDDVEHIRNEEVENTAVSKESKDEDESKVGLDEEV